MGSQEANDTRRSHAPRLASARKFVFDFHHHFLHIRLVIDETESRAVEGERPESDAEVSTISTDNTTDDLTTD